MAAPERARRLVTAILLGFAFVAAALATRLPFRDRTLFISDSGRYALALERYDVTLGRPHPPGNPLYVGLASAVDAVVHDPPKSLAIVSALASGLALFLAWLLGRDVAGEEGGWIAAGILATSPLFWFFGAVAMPATGEAALSLLLAWLARRARDPHAASWFWAMTITLAVSIGFRSTFAVLIVPLWIYAGYRHPKGRLLAGAATLAAAFFGWSLLVAHLSGGMAVYRETLSSFFWDVVLATKIFGGGFAKVPSQLLGAAASAILGLGLFLVPFLSGAWGCLTGKWPFPGAAPFLAAWAGPGLVFHAAYDWAPRFGVLLLAPAAILAAATVVPLLKKVGTARAVALLAAAVNVGVFLLPARLGPLELPEPFPSGSRLLARNADLARRDAAIRGAIDPQTSVVLAYDDTFHVVWFLPNYRVVGLWGAFKQAPDTWLPSAYGHLFSFEPGSQAIPVSEPLKLPEAVRTLVLYDDDYVRIWPRAAMPLTEVPYDPERRLALASLPGPGCLDFDLGKIAFVPAGEGRCP